MYNAPGVTVVAELEVFHSRAIAPTRRVALGRMHLPVREGVGAGGLLLGGIIANNCWELDAEMLANLHDLTVDIELGRKIAQPRLRHRLQSDRVGLLCSTHQLVRDDMGLRYRFERRHRAPVQNVLAAVYATRFLSDEQRVRVVPMLRRAMALTSLRTDPNRLMDRLGHDDPQFMAAVRSHDDPIEWACEILALDPNVPFERDSVQRQFRSLLRDAHPDTGSASETDRAAMRIAELAEARRILLM